MKRRSSKSILEVLDGSPEEPYGSATTYEQECIAEATKMLLEAKEPLEYRTKLLKALISFERLLVDYGNAFDGAGESI